MLDFDVNEGFIDRRADCVDAHTLLDAPPTGWHARLMLCHDRLPGLPS
jgi:hypothetical protein